MARGEDAYSYWLLGDDRLAVSLNSQYERFFKAHLKHTLLFHPQIIISDAMAINNFNFRQSVLFDEEIRQLIAAQLIAVAVRKGKDGSPRNLVDLRDEFIGSRKFGFDVERYKSNEELTYLQSTAVIVPFELAGLAERYSRIVLDLFLCRTTREMLGENICATIHDLARDKLERSGELGRQFFFYELEPLLAKIEKNFSWQEHGVTIKDFATKPYITALPLLIQSNPIYAPEHASAFDLLQERAAEAGNFIIDPIKFESELGLHAYVEGVSALPADSILMLLDSDECSRFQSSLKYFDGTDSSAKELSRALSGYQFVIDEEILRVYKLLRTESLDGNERALSFYQSQKTLTLRYDTVCELTSNLITYVSPFLALPPEIAMGVAMLSILLTKPIQRPIGKLLGAKSKEEAALEAKLDYLRTEVTSGRDKLIKEFEDKKSPRIKMDLNIYDRQETIEDEDVFDLETFYPAYQKNKNVK